MIAALKCVSNVTAVPNIDLYQSMTTRWQSNTPDLYITIQNKKNVCASLLCDIVHHMTTFIKCYFQYQQDASSFDLVCRMPLEGGTVKLFAGNVFLHYLQAQE